MVSINQAALEANKERKIIYIPLWYLLIQNQECIISFSDDNLHSTMVSINHFYAVRNIYGSGIYIPLWYLLIGQKNGEPGMKQNNLHSTMVSINHNIPNPICFL